LASKRPEFNPLIGDSTDNDLSLFYFLPLLMFAMICINVYVQCLCSTKHSPSRRSDDDTRRSDDDTNGDFFCFNDEPTVNIDGTPMVGDVDIHGDPYGVTSDHHHDMW
jgi:hypothetical protein